MAAFEMKGEKKGEREHELKSMIIALHRIQSKLYQVHIIDSGESNREVIPNGSNETHIHASFF